MFTCVCYTESLPELMDTVCADGILEHPDKGNDITGLFWRFGSREWPQNPPNNMVNTEGDTPITATLHIKGYGQAGSIVPIL